MSEREVIKDFFARNLRLSFCGAGPAHRVWNVAALRDGLDEHHFPSETRLTAMRIGTAGVSLALALSGCSQQPRQAPPTEQEIHASDSGDGSGTLGRHPYWCDNERRLLVDFKDEGMALELRRDAAAEPTVLIAPAAGLQYVGRTATATVSGNEIKIEEANKQPVRCRKATRL